MFGSELTYAEMYEYKDKDYDYVVRVPSFFTAQPDSLQPEKGRMRFEYGDQWITVVIESHVMHDNGQSLKEGIDSLAQVLHATWNIRDRRAFHPFFSSGTMKPMGRRSRLRGSLACSSGLKFQFGISKNFSTAETPL